MWTCRRRAAPPTTEYERYHTAATSISACRLCARRRPPQLRDDGIRRFGYAVLSHSAASSIADFVLAVATTQRRRLILLDFGAGSGYWAHVLQRHLPAQQCEVLAWDPHPEWYESGRLWFDISPAGGAQQLRALGPDVLLLVWPNWAEDVAVDALRAFEGGVLIYCGEPRGGKTANEAFFDALCVGWELAELVRVPQWPGNSDCVQVFVRTPAKAQFDKL